MEEETRQVIFETNGKTYKELYDNIIEENLKNPPPEGENTIKHHIRPKSIFPDLMYSRENLVRLTEKVHLKVHYLLWQHYKHETDDKNSENSMCYAFWRMVNAIEWKGDAELGWISDKYEELRVDFVKRISGDNNPMKNPEVRAKLMGDKNPTKRPETRAKISDATKEALKNPEVKAKRLGDKNPSKRPETRAKVSKAIKETWKNPEVKAKRLEAINRPEVREKRLEAINRPEVRAKLSEAKREWWKNNPEVGAKMNAKQFRKVLQYSLDGAFMAEYPSITEAAVKTNSHRSGISHCCTGRKKTHNGFVWKYAESK